MDDSRPQMTDWNGYVVDVCLQRQVLRHIRVIAAEAKQELMNAFRRELTLQLVAISRDHKSTSNFIQTLRRNKAAALKEKS